MEFFQQLPHLEPYGNPQYFVYVIAATLPIFIGLFFKKRFAWYEVLVSLFFIVTMLVGGKTNQLAALVLTFAGNIARTLLQALSKKQGWQVGPST